MGNNDICLKCELCLNVSHQIHGQGSTKPTIMFLYDHPTKIQDKNRDIFSGRNFGKLKTMLEDNGLFDYSYHTHFMKCRPPMAETWDYQRIELNSNRCSSIHFAKEFEDKSKHTKILVPVGKFAYQLVTSTRYIKYDDYLQLLNRPIEVDGYVIYPINSIGSLIKNGQLKHAILGIKQYYGTNYNYNLLLR